MSVLDDSEILYLPTKAAAKAIGMSAKQLEALRYENAGPRWIKVSSRIYYAKADLVAWMENHRGGHC